MKRTRIRTLASFVLVAGLCTGISGAVSSPAFAKGTPHKTYKTTGSVTVPASSLGSDGSFSAVVDGTDSTGTVTSSATLTGVQTRGPGKTTKSLATVTATPGTGGTYSAPVSAPWLTGTVTSTVTPPSGWGPPAAIVIRIKCVYDPKNDTWTWTIYWKWSSSASSA